MAEKYFDQALGCHCPGELPALLRSGRERLPVAVCRKHTLGGAVAEASQEARSALEGEVLADWSQYEQAAGMSYRQRIVVATGRR